MLHGCRREAEALTNTVCSKEPELGQRVFVNESAKCDALMWITNLMQLSEREESDEN